MDTLGRFVVTASADRTARVFDLRSMACVHTMRGHGGGIMTGVIHAVALAPDSRRAVTASDDLTLHVWDLSTGTCDAVLTGHSGWVVDVKITADGRRAASASHDGTARHAPRCTCHQSFAYLAMPPLKRPAHMGCCGAQSLCARHGRPRSYFRHVPCRIWDLLSCKCIRVLEGHSGRVNAVAVCNERNTVLTASDDSTSRVWDMDTGRCLAVLEVSRVGTLRLCRACGWEQVVIKATITCTPSCRRLILECYMDNAVCSRPGMFLPGPWRLADRGDRVFRRHGGGHDVRRRAGAGLGAARGQATAIAHRPQRGGQRIHPHPKSQVCLDVPMHASAGWQPEHVRYSMCRSRHCR